ncbi:MAG: HAD-IIIC family phosphatase [Candidatus Aureabacteria bacterium]|nr:HAD-IIIC family phosphatase [Candidatus Auribacterota bacterium]
MRLLDALELLKRPAPDKAQPLRVYLACSFTPLHLQTFLTAHLRSLLPDRRVNIKIGLYGDLAGNLGGLAPSDSDVLAVVLEWPDLDLRLGVRNLGGWRAEDLPDIMETADQRLSQLGRSLKILSSSLPVVICMPTLPLPPLFFPRTQQGAMHELQLRNALTSFALAISREPGVRIVNPQSLDGHSLAGDRFDLRSEVTTGFPYTMAHASSVAELLAVLIHNPAPKKGLITDLDDTLWAGILGEVGVEGLTWSLDQHAHLHGLYQQFLASLASAGVLLGVASKNDPALVEKAFARTDLLLSREDIFPFEVHWNRKSGSVQRILETWNIGSDAVVFIDDSPMEVAEVKAVFPDMECVVFPQSDYPAFWKMLGRLRDLFGKSVVSTEDEFRLRSIRDAGVLRELSADAPRSLDEFLSLAEAKIRFTFGKSPMDPRALELINKTNQFNLNGARFNEAAWMSHLKDPAKFLLVVNYEDKFGPLGKIAVITGKADRRRLSVDAWVMSCRAFSRRIEHQCLKYLFKKFAAEEIVFDFRETPRNGPLQEFLAQWFNGPLSGNIPISGAAFSAKAPSLYHRVEEEVLG